MNARSVVPIGVVAIFVLTGVAGAASAGTTQLGSDQPGSDTEDYTVRSSQANDPAVPSERSQGAITDMQDENGAVGEDEDEDEDAGASFLGDWLGLGGEAKETPYIGLVELGVLVLTLGLGGYMIGKRSSLVPVQYRRHLLPAHEWSMLVGTALTAPHFFAVEEWEGLGFAVGVLLAIEVASGLYGRHLHRHVIRLSRGNETSPIFGYLLDVSKDTVFDRWRWIHRSLTVVTAVVLVLHVATALGG